MSDRRSFAVESPNVKSMRAPTQRPYISIVRVARTVVGGPGQAAVTALPRDQPGLVSFMMIDAGGGTAVSLVTYADRHAAEAGGKLGINWMKETLADMLPQQIAATTGGFKLRILQEAPVAT